MFENPLSISRMAGPENFCLFGRDTEISENPSELHAEQNKSNNFHRIPLISRNKKNKDDYLNQEEAATFFVWHVLDQTLFWLH